jgi:capsular polysaccharide biosynthesis protein
MVTTSTYLATAIAFLTVWVAVSLALLLESKKERFEDLEDIIRGVYDAPLLGSV